MMRHPHVWMGLLLWSIFSQAQAAWTVNMAPGATEISHAVFDLHMTIFWICVVIGIIVFGAMFWSMMVHRRTAVDHHRPEHGAEDDDADHYTDPENGHVQVKYCVTDFSRSRRHIHSPGGLRLAENRPQQEAHPDMWMSHHCGFPLSFLLSRRLTPAARERLFQTTNLNRRALLHRQSGVIS